MGVARVGAMLRELQLGLRLHFIRRRERKALVRLGAAAAGLDLRPRTEVAQLLEQISAAHLRIAELREAIRSSIEADRDDFPTVSPAIHPIVIVRGVCTRVILRHQLAALISNQQPLHQALATTLLRSDASTSSLPEQLVREVLSTRGELAEVSDTRATLLVPYGGSALPRWLPHLGHEARHLSSALWLQFKPHVLPRFPALIALAVGWWIAHTYTSSPFKSVLHSLGIGNGGRRVVSGDTYRTMQFWLPVLAAGLCAYLTERIKIVIQRRYGAPRPEGSAG